MRMLTALRDAIFGGPAISIPTIAPADEAARRLSNKTSDWKFPLGLHDMIVGSVSVDRVVLSRVRPFFNFGAAPVFRGRFVAERGGTYLVGQFQLDPIAKTFMTIWFGGVGVFCTGSLILGPVTAIQDNSALWLGVLIGVAFALLGIVFGIAGYFFLRFLRWLSKSDIGRIVAHIENHVGHQHAG